MKVKQFHWQETKGWQDKSPEVNLAPQILLVFGATDQLSVTSKFKEISDKYPKAEVLGCSTAGEILNDSVYDNTITVTAIEFEKTPYKVAITKVLEGTDGSKKAGQEIGHQLKKSDLVSVILISDGLSVNGSELVKGVQDVVGSKVIITGGLAGDNGRFQKTGVVQRDSFAGKQVLALGLYGDNIQVGHGSYGGWGEFGPLRKITKSTGNVVFEIDGSPALELYKKYLGPEHIKALPGSALLFPIVVYPEGKSNQQVVRTVLAVNEKDNSMTFAGDVPVGWSAQLMRANFDELIDAAGKAGSSAGLKNTDTQKLALLISCVGRKMIMGQRTPDEVESVMEAIGGKVASTGFYSYGEISPLVNTEDSCALHNQTMTVTVLAEKA